jgi:L,D-transpeptidase YcbB
MTSYHSRPAALRLCIGPVLAGLLGMVPAHAQTFGAPSVPSTGFVQPQIDAPQAVTAAPKAKASSPRRPVPAAAARETALTDDPRPTLTTDTAIATAIASERYLGITEAGGWPVIARGAYKQGASGPAIVALKRRLALSGDLPAEMEAGSNFDASVTTAVKRFQMRHGLRQTGLVSGRTLHEMNVSAAQRFRQLASSAQRLAGSAFPYGQRYVVVNIPSASVEAIENGEVAKRYIAVVGKAERASPTVETRITTVNLNPTWTVPTSIIKKDIIPKMQKDPGYLAKARIKMLDGRGEEVNPRSIDWKTERAANFTLRQDPGAGNSLGQMRIDMPNKHAVYMHDTPSKRLFSSDERFHSSGCVRVQNVRDFAGWLLAPQGISLDMIDEGIDSEERKDFRLRNAVPVAWVYMTGYATADGTVHFRPDVYSWDKIGNGALNRQAQLN